MNSYDTADGDEIGFRVVSSDSRADENDLDIDHATVRVEEETLTIDAKDDSNKITDAFEQDYQIRVMINPQGESPVAYQGLLTDETTLRAVSRWHPDS